MSILRGIRGNRFNGFLLRTVLIAGLAYSLVMSFNVRDARAESLRQALERSLAVNPTISAERERVRAVEEELDIAGANFRPSVSLNGDVNRQNTFTAIKAGQNTDDTITEGGYSLNINQPIYRGGRTVAALNQAEANILQARETLRNVRQSTLFEVSAIYVAVVRDTAIKELRLNTQNLLGEQFEAAKTRLKAGLVTKTDVSLAKSRFSAAKSDTIQADANLETSRAEYERLTGRRPRSLNYPGLRRKSPASNLVEAIRIGKNESPLIRAARYARDAAGFAIDEIRGERLPEVNLEAGYAQRWGSAKTIDETRVANIRLRATVPLYQGGAVRARTRQAQSSLRRSDLLISEAQRRVRSQVVSSWKNMMAARTRMESSAEQVQAAKEALDGVKNEEKVGQRTLLDVLDAERELLQAKVVTQQAKGDYISTYFRLLTAMGRFNGSRVY